MPSITDILPPLPGSDQESLDKNKFDGFYKVRARDFWGDNKINRFEEPKDNKHEHQFIATPTGAECEICRFGLFGKFEISNKKLFYKGDPIGI